MGTTLPARAGLGLKHEHMNELLATRPALGFVEVHAENFMVDGGPVLQQLARVREHYPLALHGVGLSIGGEAPPDPAHLARLAALARRFEPAVCSEHLAWSSHGGVFFNDLLPLPYHRATLDRVCAHIHQVQERLQRRLLLENPSTYLAFEASTLSETQFLREVVQRTGCGLLLDVNNLHVSCTNQGLDAQACLRELPLQAVGELHLAGFATDRDAAGAPLLIDHHGSPVDAAVWSLFEAVLALTGPLPTLLERDHDVPALPVLLAECGRAQALLAKAAGSARRAA